MKMILAMFVMLVSTSAYATCSSVPFSFSAGALAQSGQVNANFASVVSCVNGIDAAQIISGTLSNSRLAAIPNTSLANSSIIIGSTTITLGSTASTIANVTLSNPTISNQTASGGSFANPTISGSVTWSGTGNMNVAQDLIFTNGSGSGLADLRSPSTNVIAARNSSNSGDADFTASRLSAATIATAGSTTLCESLGAYESNYLGIVACASDARLKNIGAPLADGATALVGRLKPTGFSWKSDDSNAPHSGFIAQDVQTVMPECVTQNPDGYFSIESNCLLAYEAKAVQELNARLTAHGM